MKDQNVVIEEFNEHVNMTASELEKWLKSNDSRSAGWPKEGENGESVGHDSGRKIVEILKSNPRRDPKNYSGEQIPHMRKVVSYCKRHLAQEAKANSQKSAEELKKTKSYASLKNWGHDILKTREQGSDGTDEKAEANAEGGGDKPVGEKRKAARNKPTPNKKRETRQGKARAVREDDDANEDEDEEDEEDEEEEAEDDHEENKDEYSEDDDDKEQEVAESTRKSNGKTTNGNKQNAKQAKGKGGVGDSKSHKGPNKGDTVSWNWGSGKPKGKVLDVKAEETTITTKRGNKVTRKGDSEDPAVVLDAGRSKAIKLNHELN